LRGAFEIAGKEQKARGALQRSLDVIADLRKENAAYAKKAMDLTLRLDALNYCPSDANPPAYYPSPEQSLPAEEHPASEPGRSHTRPAEGPKNLKRATPTYAPQSRLKLSDPAIFDGDGDVEARLRKMERKLHAGRSVHQGESSRVAYFLSRIDGQAEKYLNPYLCSQAFQSVADIINVPSALYIDPNRRMKAADAYRGIMMKQDEQFVVFRSRFELAAGEADIPDHLRLHDLYARLSTSLQRALAPCRDELKTYTALAEKCRVVDGLLREVDKREARLGRNWRNSVSNAPNTTRALRASRAAPTAANALQTTTSSTHRAPTPKITEALRKQLTREGLCSFCHTAGHAIDACSKLATREKTRTTIANTTGAFCPGDGESKKA